MIRFNNTGNLYFTNPITFYDEMTGLVDKGKAVDVVSFSFSQASVIITCSLFIIKLIKYGLDK